MAIRIECNSEVATSSKPATVRIYESERLVAEVTAAIQQEKGADGGYYDVVKLTKSAKE